MTHISVVPPGGKHVILDMQEVDENLLRDETRIIEILETAAKVSGATVLFSKFHHFGGEHGITGVVALAESHISIHTWPAENYAAVDVFMCGGCDPIGAAAYIRKNFGGKSKMEVILRKLRKNLKV